MDFEDHLRTTGGALKNWAFAQLQDSLAVGVLWLIGLYILHVPLAPMWALIAAVLQIVPHLGPILGLLGPVLAATIKWMDWEHPLGVLALYAVIVLFDGLLLQPYIMRRTAKVPVWASVLTRSCSECFGHSGECSWPRPYSLCCMPTERDRKSFGNATATMTRPTLKFDEGNGTFHQLPSLLICI